MSLLKRVLVFLQPHGTILAVFACVWAALCARHGVRLRWTDGTVVLPALFVVALLLASAVSGRAWGGRMRGVLHDWLPFVGASVVYESLREFTGVLRQAPIDAALERADRWLFLGTSPTLWMSRVQTPLLTDYFALAYNLYFILPFFLVVLLYLRGRRRDYVELASALVLTFYAGFVLYLVFPAGPPRFYAPFQHELAPLRSFVLSQTQGRWDALNPVKVYASFPSLHCALATVTLCYALRFDGVLLRSRVLVAIVAPLVVSLWLSTVYLRHHWVVDVFAGQALGLVAYVTSGALRRVFARMERQLDGERSPRASASHQLIAARR
jgi:membrane-associated phospholipid phosphatase